MFTHTLRSAHLALSSSSVADLVEQQKATKRLSQVLVARDTHRKTTVFADLVWAFWRSRIPRDANSLISLVSVEVRHLRCRSNLIHKAALGLLGTCVELMTAAISPSAQRAQETAMGISSPLGNFVLERTFFGPPARWFFLRFVQVSIINNA